MLICTKANQARTLVNVSVIRHFIAVFKNIATGRLVHALVVRFDWTRNKYYLLAAMF